MWIWSGYTPFHSAGVHSRLQSQPGRHATLVVEMGVGMRITREYGYRLVDGILNVMRELGLWEGGTAAVREPVISTDRAVSYLNADKAGIYVPQVQIGEQ